MNPTTRLAVALLASGVTFHATSSSAQTPLQKCLAEKNLPQVVRMLGGNERVSYARVLKQEDGIPTAVIPFANGDTPLAEVFDRAVALEQHGRMAPWELSTEEAASRICAPVSLSQREIDDEQRVVVATGLNYRAHAEEAGGGDVFIFPKPAAPTPPYGVVAAPAGVTLLDYEVELGFVLLDDIDLTSPPERDEFLEKTAFFVTNDISDREAIIRNASLSGPGTGFVEAKGQPGFLPTGPWMVRGRELYGAMAECGAEGLGIRLSVDEGNGFEPRQDSMTSLMIVAPPELPGELGALVASEGIQSSMPVPRSGTVRTYPFAVDERNPRVPAGSVLLMGTPAGVALQMPGRLGLLGRALIRLRSPLDQLMAEQRAMAASGEPGSYLAPGDRVRASIDGLGTQLFRVLEAGSPIPVDPCEAAEAR